MSLTHPWTGFTIATKGYRGLAFSLLAAGMAVGCATPAPAPSNQHLDPEPQVSGQAPEFAVALSLPKPPKPSEKPEFYSVVVQDMAVHDILFALARDAKLNVSVHPGISGNVTMSMIDQTLPEILDAISDQVDLRYELDGKKLSITPDTPFLRMYRVSYPNIARKSQSAVSTSTNVASTGGGAGGGGGSNASSSTLTDTADNMFWETLVNNLRDLLRETDKVITENQSAAPSAPPAITAVTPVQSLNTATNQGAATANKAAQQPAPQSYVVARQETLATPSVTYREAASIIANPENGIINVRATKRQHEKVREFLDGIMENARRQVLIEATIVEVDLSDRFQQGIDWSLLHTTGSAAGSGIVITPAGLSSGLLTGGLLSSIGSATYTKNYPNGSISAAIQLLESFGTLRVLSSPKLSVLNSQTSVLKVVDNEVYFTIDVVAGTAATLTTPATAPTYTSRINTVPIGFLMTVTPQINSDNDVILNLRPTISRISSYATDPNPVLKQAGVTNMIPIVQSREMESIMRVQSGDIAVLGGLIQDSRDHKVDSVPGVNQVPVLGDLFSFKDNKSRKTELVIFIRPTVLTDASLDGNFQSYRAILSESKNALGPTRESGRAPAERP